MTDPSREEGDRLDGFEEEMASEDAANSARTALMARLSDEVLEDAEHSVTLVRLRDINADLEEEVKRQAQELADLQALLILKERELEVFSTRSQGGYEHADVSVDTSQLQAVIRELRKHTHNWRVKHLVDPVASGASEDDAKGEVCTREVQFVDRVLSCEGDALPDADTLMRSLAGVVNDLKLAMMENQFNTDEINLELSGLKTHLKDVEKELNDPKC